MNCSLCNDIKKKLNTDFDGCNNSNSVCELIKEFCYTNPHSFLNIELISDELINKYNKSFIYGFIIYYSDNYDEFDLHNQKVSFFHAIYIYNLLIKQNKLVKIKKNDYNNYYKSYHLDLFLLYHVFYKYRTNEYIHPYLNWLNDFYDIRYSYKYQYILL